MGLPFPKLTPEEAAEFINDKDTLGFSGFTAAGATKAIPPAIAARAEEAHRQGKPFRVGVVTGASTGPSLDGALAKADAISFRTPYQSDPDLRQRINSGQTRFFDMHLSLLPQMVRYGFLGRMQCAIVEACDINGAGEIVLTASVGATPTFCTVSDKILVEVNRRHPATLRGFHDIYEPKDPPHRREFPIYKPSDRIGSEVVKVDPKKILGIVETDCDDESKGFDAPSDVTTKIGQNVAEFLAAEVRSGRIPKTFLPLQSGVGDIANAVLKALGDHDEIPPFEMYTEVIQDSVIRLMRENKVKFASSCSLTVSPEILQLFYENLEYFRPRVLLRPQEITNQPEIVRRLGIISINTAVEVDIFGNVNSTHILGRNMVNGIGGSGDFTRNAFISIFTCPSTQKGGKISTVVPLASHMDHSEHSVQIIATEQGVADLRGKDPHDRARLIVEKCSHPDFRSDLMSYYSFAQESHTPQALSAAFAFHQQYMRTGGMRGVNWQEVMRDR